MPLPPALLERLKRRKIIKVVESGGSGMTIPDPRQTDNDEDTAQRPLVSTASVDHLQARYGHVAESSKEDLVAQSEQEEILAADYSEDNNDRDDDDHNHNDSAESDSGEDEFGESDADSDKSNQPGVDEDGESRGRHTAGQGRRMHVSTSTTDDLTLGRSSDGDDDQSDDGDRRRCDHQQQSDTDPIVLGCPNKYNIYHTCSQYCRDHYGKPKQLEPTYEQRKQLATLLRAFPVSNEWSIVYDPGVETFYFWNIINNQVSWLPPGMGNFATPSADHIRQTVLERRVAQATSGSMAAENT